MPISHPVLCLVGPTASGKSAAAFALAQRWRTEIIMADSRQLYRGMAIGTDQPPPSWQQRVVHHGVGILSPRDAYNAGRFCRAAEPVIARLHTEGRIPIVVGGTGLYVRALLYGLAPTPPADDTLRRRLQWVQQTYGVNLLHDWLRDVDPESAAAIAPADGHKLIRALEIYLLTGRPRASWHASHQFRSARYDHVVVGLRHPRPVLYRRIEDRVEHMVRQGLVQEAEQLWADGFDEHHPAMQGLGYRQLLQAFQGRCSVDEAIGRTVLETRRYAKRQCTWFQRQPEIDWLDLDGGESGEIVADGIVRLSRARWAAARQCAIMAPVFSRYAVDATDHALSAGSPEGR